MPWTSARAQPTLLEFPGLKTMASPGPKQHFARASLLNHITKGMAADASKPGSFLTFQKLCTAIEHEGSSKAKTHLVSQVITRQTPNLYTFVRLLLPNKKIDKRVYGLQDKALVKVFARVLGIDADALMLDQKQGTHAGNVGDVVQQALLESKLGKAAMNRKSTYSLADVDAFLDRLSAASKETEYVDIFSEFLNKATATDLKFLVRLVKHDLRMGAGPKPILDALDVHAYGAWKIMSDLRVLVKQIQQPGGVSKVDGLALLLMTPCKPMLAEACKTYDKAVKKCGGLMYAEIKYDGERVQVHYDAKTGKFQFFSRSLKPLQSHKTNHIKDYFPKSCAKNASVILDGEILMWDTKNKTYLPFGTLGVHKKERFENATVCIVIFDLLYYDQKSLLHVPLKERRELLEKCVKTIPGRIHLSELHKVKKADELKVLMARCMRDGLEGLVIKDPRGDYVPGMRRWLKMKKDYLDAGAMADSADLVVLGAYYGSGAKGGVLSTFLMCAWDSQAKQWKTVCKCGNGFTDKEIDKLQTSLDMKVINGDPSGVPKWLDVVSALTPDAVVRDPRAAPVWEVTGAQYSLSKRHTADGISIRFPRITRVRTDKNWKSATDVSRLRKFVSMCELSEPALLDALGLKRVSKPDQGAASSQKKRSLPGFMKKRGRDSPSKPRAKTVKRRKKEKAADEDEEDDVDVRPLCKYGSKCFRTNNPKHLAEFLHPHIGQGKDDYDPDFVVDGDVEDGKLEDDNDLDGIETSNIVRGRRRRKRVTYREPDSDDDFDVDEVDHFFDEPGAKNDEDYDEKDEDVEEDEDEDEDGTGGVDEPRPRCRYWDNCYRKNPQHLADFLHPRDLKKKEEEHKKEEEEEDATMQDVNATPAQEDDEDDGLLGDWAVPTPQGEVGEVGKLAEEETQAAALPSTSPAVATASSAAMLKRNPSLPDSDLPNIFSDLDCYIHSNVPKKKKLFIQRLFIAYDGQMSRKISVRTTHVIVAGRVKPEDLQIPAAVEDDVVVVDMSWAIQSIKQKELLPEDDFLVQ